MSERDPSRSRHGTRRFRRIRRRLRNLHWRRKVLMLLLVVGAVVAAAAVSMHISLRSPPTPEELDR